MNRTIVVGYIDTPEGHAAVAAAADEARRRQAGLVVVNSQSGREDADKVIAMRSALSDVEDALAADGLAVEVVESAQGKDVAEDLLDTAAERDAELIIIGIRRRTALGKLLLGSTAQSILLAAECQVLAVKPPHS